MKQYLQTLWLSVLAGICIGIGGTVNLSVENTVAGAFLFSVGLFMIVVNGLHLFTGKVGYLLDNRPSYLLYLLTVWIGNGVGTAFVGYALRFTRSAVTRDGARVYSMVQAKLDDSLLSIFILSFFCGILMYLAVNGYRVIQHGAGKCIAVILPVAVFILCGFEHCVANMFYFSAANAWSGRAVGYLLVMSVGNAAGSVVFHTMNRVRGQS